ncbi:hypothetical protein LTR36_000090 [Oleoguttula mirabilis]|uniref:Uncharacterized protein n=1 Tax=Oleoguttula mirabilis TaxID=1507867 RepID=A0AAV9JY43_9PEZI|nr:hypothetical protein LTR36_000090 [Oleoguttula mirabilis]
MDWQTLAAKQRKSLDEKESNIDQLNQQLTSYSKQIGDLEYKLAEQNEKLERAAQSHETISTDKISKLQLRSQIAEDERDKLAKHAQSFASREQKLLEHNAKLEAQLKDAQVPAAAANDSFYPSTSSSQRVNIVQDTVQSAAAENERLRSQVQGLHRQLQAEKSENAKWLGLSTGKPGYDRDQDDDEPPLEKKMPNRKPNKQQSTPTPNPHTTLPTTFQQPAENATPFSSTSISSAQFQSAGHGAAQKRTAPRMIVTLPIRSTLSTQKAPAAPKKSITILKAAALKVRLKSSTQKPLAPPEKVPAKIEASHRARGSKRRRSAQDENNEGMRELDPQSSEQLPTTRKKHRPSLAEQLEAGMEFEPLEGDSRDTMEFTFTAIESYAADGSGNINNHESEEMKYMPIGELWDRIHRVQDFWELKKGKHWRDIFETSSKAKCCVTKRVKGGGGTQWRAGCDGKYACKDCAKMKLPCFTWDATQWSFQLLPLHDDDRLDKLDDELEMHFWVNELTPEEQAAAEIQGAFDDEDEAEYVE